MSAAQAAQQNNRGPSGQYGFGTHAEPESLKLAGTNHDAAYSYLHAQAERIQKTHPIVVSPGTKFLDGSPAPEDFNEAWVQRWRLLETERAAGRTGDAYGQALRQRALEASELGETLIQVEGLSTRVEVQLDPVLQRPATVVNWSSSGCGDGSSDYCRGQDPTCECQGCEIRGIGRRHGAMLVESEPWNVKAYFSVDPDAGAVLIEARKTLSTVRADAQELEYILKNRTRSPWSIFEKPAGANPLGEEYREAGHELKKLKTQRTLEDAQQILDGRALTKGSLAHGASPEEDLRAENWTRARDLERRAVSMSEWAQSSNASAEIKEELEALRAQAALDKQRCIAEAQHLVDTWPEHARTEEARLLGIQEAAQIEARYASYPGPRETRPPQWLSRR